VRHPWRYFSFGVRRFIAAFVFFLGAEEKTRTGTPGQTAAGTSSLEHTERRRVEGELFAASRAVAFAPEQAFHLGQTTKRLSGQPRSSLAFFASLSLNLTWTR
jgi:hypothetical protein